MAPSASPYGYIISRSSLNDRYGLWKFDPEGKQLLTPVPLTPGASYPRTNQLTSIGGYFLGWSRPRDAMGAPYFEFALVPTDVTSPDPLNAAPLQHGQWSKNKFFGHLPDFGSSTGNKKQFEQVADLELIPMGTFLLNFIPTAGRGTFGLWNFDPCPTAPGTVDPIPGNFSFTAQASFRDIQEGHELLPMNGYVIDRVTGTGDYRLWSFDPQNRDPLAYPHIQSGTWDDVGKNDVLVPVGGYVLQWNTATRRYRVLKFDPTDRRVLIPTKRQGKLPGAFTPSSTMLGFQPNIPVNKARARTPGTVDYMRTNVKHVVYYMLENRAFDHVVGWLHEKNNRGVHVIGPKGPYKGASTSLSNVDPSTGKPVHLSKYNGGKPSNKIPLEWFTFDPYHDLSDVLRQFFHENRDGYAEKDRPDMGGFVWNNGDVAVMQTYSPEQLPVLNGLAGQFAISDEWFCSVPSSTDANRAFALTGSTMNELNNFMTPPQYIYWPEQPHRPSIFKTLWTNGFTDWRIYNSTQWQQHVFTYQLFLEGQIPTVDANVAAGFSPTQHCYVEPIAQFYKDALAGQLPAFSYLEPVWIGGSGTTSYHPGADLVLGERQLNDVYDAISKGPGWENTMLFLTFDEHGGIYDHVAPPYTVNPWPNDVNNGFRYDIMGPRVATIVVSPLVEPKTVFRSGTEVAYDATSFLAMLLEWYGIPRDRWFLGDRTHQAPTFERVLSRRTARKSRPRFKPPTDVNFPPGGKDNPSQVVNHLAEIVAHTIISRILRGKLPPDRVRAVSHEILTTSHDMTTLTKRIDELVKQYE